MKISDAVEYSIELAKKERIDEFQIVAESSKTLRVVVENKEFSLLEENESIDISFDAIHQKKRGTLSLNTLREEMLKEAVLQSKKLSAYGIQDDYLGFADIKQAPVVKDFEFAVDKKVSKLTAEEVLTFAKESLGLFLADNELAVDRLELSAQSSQMILQNSLGVKQEQKDTTLSLDLAAMAGSGDEVTGVDYDSLTTYSVNDFQKNLKTFTQTFIERIKALQNPKRVNAYKGLVVFSPRAFDELFLDMFCYHISGRQLMDKKSRWTLSDLNKKLFDSSLSLFDDPHHSQSMGSTTFDRDGIPTQKRYFIKEGVLQNISKDVYSAKKMGIKPDGTAGAPFCLSLTPGEKTLSELLKKEKEVVLIDRFSGNCDYATGQFSGVAKGARLIRQGKMSEALVETMIAGNFFDIAKNIYGISKEQVWVSRVNYLPYVIFDAVSIS